MKKVLIYVMALFSMMTFSMSQSTPELYWKKIETLNFKIIFPNYSEHEAQEILTYLTKYRRINSSTYNIDPKPFTLVLRSQMATQNGFVTLAPTRSEWFSSSSFNATLGSLNWYEALAVHEYRHFVQFENLNTGLFRIASYLFGDIGLGIALGWTTHPWYYEGDAVWAETNFTDAGRGRSARFFALAKSMIENNNFPTLDELLGGDFRYKNPNHYVWGYLIIEKAMRDYGENVWDNVTMEIPSRIYNPFAIYTAFKAVTRKDFNQFYSEMISELSREWGGKKHRKRKKNYNHIEAVVVDNGLIYTIESSLDSHTALFENGIKLLELDIDPESSKIDIKNKKMIYTKVESDGRYKYKETSDLYVYDIKKKSTRKITKGKRFFNPSWTSEDTLLALEFDNLNYWSLVEMNSNGVELQRIATNGRINEAVGVDDEIFYISQNKIGRKEIWRKNKKSHTRILGPSSNVIFNLRLTQEGLIFEADAKEIKVKNYLFSNNKFYKLLNNDDFAFFPNISGSSYIYANQEQDGNFLKKIEINKKEVNADEILNVYGRNPKSAKDVKEQEVASSKYDEYEGMIIPHSWSFIGSRGFQVSGEFSNTIGTYSQQVTVGNNNVNKTNFATVSLSYEKYYPKISLFADYNEKNEKIYVSVDTKYKWAEKLLGASLSLPYSKKIGLYNFSTAITGSYYYVDIDGESNRAITSLSNDEAKIKEISYRIHYLKTQTYRALYPKFGISAGITYSDADVKKQVDSHILTMKNTIYVPGFFKNDGFKLVQLYTKHKDKVDAYRIRTGHLSGDSFRFSRETDYNFYPKTSRYIANYSFPISSFSLRVLGDWLYLNRVIGNIFSDKTIVDKSSQNEQKKFFANGLDISLGTMVMRKVPTYLTYTLLKSSNNETESLWSIGLNEAF